VSVGQPYYSATVRGLLTFRGNPTRTYHGQGPLPQAPRALWRYPVAAMCSLSSPLMGSPSVVDGIWIQGDCGGVLHAYDVRDPHADPPEMWQVPLGSCIESTPAIWNGRIYIGTRGGFVHGIGDQ
jgi:outer membrane protein assembly factor BamB